MTRILKGKPVIDSLNTHLKSESEGLRSRGLVPVLAIVRVGENADDVTYERSAEKCCAAAGVEVKKYLFAADVREEEILSAVRAISVDKNIHGALILRPLPPHIDDRALCRALAPEKDVDGITEYSMAGVYSDKRVGFSPCTAEACIDMLKHYNIEIAGRRAVVVGRSFVVGKPAAMMLLRENATVTICHTKTKELAALCREAEILVVATGHAKLITEGFFSPRQTIIDVGINVDEEGKLCGDVDREKAEGIVSAIAPVPGGIGRVTTAVLAKHVIEACKRSALKET
ncbi:bifunctional 5,10-methylenetetrahydrofolate dehydrogenase/5,10-methenyltetrahydrofolate cyclohydrolase [Synergistes jonesii]|uniref:Bifunctional protein FolD n=1 Tax=Synergistes jonesii TaxID=2754 RepID=A0A073J670_9BACT|nr:bifunctional 5,10-methylenetetrahydrofolate dehydrogenase/5,10-methenyltetrahydrofolate cyclohydrolase [Synergistes jonesii]KEJ93222.1 methenyltetrahydrofolate cyclohydrolase [Synergistes jonesii]OFB63346.1 methenyltetrahydrofolate cyclohydrolase [Synergistes jonesii]OFB64947.1 methenyltetrahydrofolate cyclohydrolase [Synergistes jonesii]OFB66219.1 methenyltetrahydrofolate cyclohydrolase [Synergistes jonesii]OFB68985.1 methenyltetrahydrofolate cyclohydrolase [Synergistes jonesii]